MNVPHVIPYQGSKRNLADRILKEIQFSIVGRLYEPFAGSAAITLAGASRKLAGEFVIGDKYQPLMQLWELIISEPEMVCEQYREIWNGQLDNPKEYYLRIRNEFNIDNDPVKFLYLIARCVKNSIRFNSQGGFNQSPDNRRLGRRPAKMATEIRTASNLLSGNTVLRSGDFMEILEDATSEDIVYMDPPWQGTSTNRDPRYAYLLDLECLVDGLRSLNARRVPFLLSFDGTSGKRTYGQGLPDDLNLTRVSLDAGRSSQATLLGRSEKTIESLYLSPVLAEMNHDLTEPTFQQARLFA